MRAIAAIDHRRRGVSLGICMLVACSGVTFSAATLVAASQVVFARFNPSAVNLPSPRCDAATPYGHLLLAASDWDRQLPANTGNDGATFDVFSNYEPNRTPSPCAGGILFASDLADRWGAEFQCAELAIRVADGEWAIGDAAAWRRSGWNGSAEDMFVHHPSQLTAVVNGSGSLPQPGDLLVWSPSNDHGDPGHVAVVAAVGRDRVAFVGENQRSAVATVPRDGSLIENDGWKSGASTILGWLRGPARPVRHPSHGRVASAPAGVGPQVPAYEVAFQAQSGDLWAAGTSSPKAAGLSVASGTSPSIASLTDGGFEVAFQAADTGHIWAAGSAGLLDTGFSALPGTSPSIAALAGDGYEVAMQTTAGDLVTAGPTGTTDWNLGMLSGTSPSIVGLAGGGYEVAFQANTNHLYVAGSAGTQDSGLEMLLESSPSITALANGGYEIAFQANTGQLWTIGAAGGGATGLGMLAGTSPSIVGLAGGGYEVAFQANTGELWTLGGAVRGSSGLGMLIGTSPSIAALAGGGFSVAFQSNTHHLWHYGVGGTADSGLEMSAGTSPSIAALPLGDATWPFAATPLPTA